jgi:hypothetical protein
MASYGYSNFPITITIIGGQDIEAPVLTNALGYSPASLTVVNTPGANNTIGTFAHELFAATANCSDQFSGCSSVVLVFESPPGRNGVIVRKSVTLQVISPVDQNCERTDSSRTIGQGQCRMQSSSNSLTYVSETAAVGTGPWNLVKVTVTDRAKNSREYTTAELTALGFPTTLNVAEGTFPPRVQPVIKQWSFEPATVDMLTGSQQICFNVTVEGTFNQAPRAQFPCPKTYMMFSGPSQFTVNCDSCAQGAQCTRTTVGSDTRIQSCFIAQQWVVRRGTYFLTGLAITDGAPTIGLDTEFRVYGQCNGRDDHANGGQPSICFALNSGVSVSASMWLSAVLALICMSLRAL